MGLLLVGCDSTGSTMNDDLQSGSLSMNMTGSDDGTTAGTNTTQMGPPSVGELESAIVTIDEVAVVPVEDTSDTTDVGVRALSNENFEVDLVDLQAGLDTSLAEFEVEAGTYGQIRLITAEEVALTFNDGSTGSVMIASGQETGLKIDKFDPFTIDSADDRINVTLNWDVNESLKGNGNVITPVIDATVETTSAGS